jgi:hypothetical protein
MRMTIELGRGATYSNRRYTVYRLDRYPRGSVLQGQQRRTWVNQFHTIEAAQAAYPTAEIIAGTTYQEPYLSHLPEDDDY